MIVIIITTVKTVVRSKSVLCTAVLLFSSKKKYEGWLLSAALLAYKFDLNMCKYWIWSIV